MLLQRVEVPASSTFYLLNTGIYAFRDLAHIDDEVERAQVIPDMLDALKCAAKNGWFYVNPRNDSQLIAYCDAYRKPFWFVVVPGDTSGFKHIEKDYAVVTVLSHRDSRFRDAIGEHRSRAEEDALPT